MAEEMRIRTETSWKNDEIKVMLNANDLLLFLLEDVENEPKEVTKYCVRLAKWIASIIRNPGT